MKKYLSPSAGSSISPYKPFNQLRDPLPAGNAFEPFGGDAVHAVVCAGDGAGYGGGGIGVAAEVYGLQHAVGVAIGVQEAPKCSLQRRHHIASAFDPVLGQRGKGAHIIKTGVALRSAAVITDYSGAQRVKHTARLGFAALEANYCCEHLRVKTAACHTYGVSVGEGRCLTYDIGIIGIAVLKLIQRSRQYSHQRAVAVIALTASAAFRRRGAVFVSAYCGIGRDAAVKDFSVGRVFAVE